ncbi:MAG: GntR family transcriptional regulator [Hyphomicrobiales bacterium]|nr:GntR family transcriptional regulator [Hyphomicrobiales bacterium]MCP5001600.1 GntR family transcriptional regulator [Hyphomicrobiales bacterium]
MPSDQPEYEKKQLTADLQRIILERICFLDYKPGDQLKEAELAAEFGVSRTPVRDAIGRISHLGLIESRNGVGTVVIRLSDQEIADIYEMRLQLAPLIGDANPIDIDDTHLERAESLLSEAIELENTIESRKYVRLNHKLNQLIADLIGNGILRSFWLQTYWQAASTWHQVAENAGNEVGRALVEELTDLKAALEQRDLQAVGYIQRIHIGYGYARIKAHIFKQQHSPQTAGAAV